MLRPRLPLPARPFLQSSPNRTLVGSAEWFGDHGALSPLRSPPSRRAAQQQQQHHHHQADYYPESVTGSDRSDPAEAEHDGPRRLTSSNWSRPPRNAADAEPGAHSTPWRRVRFRVASIAASIPARPARAPDDDDWQEEVEVDERARWMALRMKASMNIGDFDPEHPDATPPSPHIELPHVPVARKTRLAPRVSSKPIISKPPQSPPRAPHIHHTSLGDDSAPAELGFGGRAKSLMSSGVLRATSVAKLPARSSSVLTSMSKKLFRTTSSVADDDDVDEGAYPSSCTADSEVAPEMRTKSWGSVNAGNKGDEGGAKNPPPSSPAAKRLVQLTAEVHAALALLRNERLNRIAGSAGEGAEASAEVGDMQLANLGDALDAEDAIDTLGNIRSVTGRVKRASFSPAQRRSQGITDNWKCVPLLEQIRPVSVMAASSSVMSLAHTLLGKPDSPDATSAVCESLAAPGSGMDVAAVVGPPGVGKAAACEMLARSRTGSNQFRDGTIWIRVGGAQVTLVAIADCLADAMRMTGAQVCLDTLLRNVAAGTTHGGPAELVRALLDLAVKRFANRSVLIVLEGCWTSQQDVSVATALSPEGGVTSHTDVAACKNFELTDVVQVFRTALSRASFGSRLLVCTTDLTLASHAVSSLDKIVQFPERVDEQVARDIFRLHAQLQEHGQDEDLASVGHGHPLSIALAGRLFLSATNPSASVITTPSKYSPTRIDYSTGGVMPNSLASLITKALEMLDTGLIRLSSAAITAAASATSSGEPPLSWTQMYLSLAVLPVSKPMAPLAFLMRLWTISRKSAARAIVSVMTSLGLATFGNGMIVLHDAHLAYCKVRCGQDPNYPLESAWHLRVLMQYALSAVSGVEVAKDDDGSWTQERQKLLQTAWDANRMALVSSSTAGSQETSRLIVPRNLPWWDVCAKTAAKSGAKYLHSEIVRHIVSAPGGLQAAADLLSDYRYLRQRCVSSGIEALKSDYKLLLKACQETTSEARMDETQRNIGTDVRLILASLDLMPIDIGVHYCVEDACCCHLSAKNVSQRLHTEQACGSKADQNVSANGGDTAEMVPESLELPCLPGDPGFANQLMGRLPILQELADGNNDESRSPGARHVGRNRMLWRLSETIFAHAQRPWLKPLTVSLDNAGGGCDRVIRVGGTVTCVALSGDGRLVVSGRVDGVVLVHDITTGRLTHRFVGHASHVLSVAISDVSTQERKNESAVERIVSSSWDGTVRVWDLSTGKCAYVLQEHSDKVFCSTLTKDGKCIASGSMDKTVCVWRSLAVGSCLEILEGHTDWVRSVALSSDGAWAVSGSDDTTIRVWGPDPTDPSALVCRNVLRGHRSRVSCLAVTPDDQYIISGSFDGSVRVWDLLTGRSHCACQAVKGKRVLSVAVPHDGQSVISGYDDGATRVWNISSGRKVGEFTGASTAGMNGMAVARDGRKIVTGSFDGCIRVWDTRRREGGRGLGAAVARIGSLASGNSQPVVHTRPVSSVAVSVDGEYLASGSWDKQIRLWRVSEGACAHVLQGHAHVITVLAFSGDSSLLASGSRDESIRLWNTRTGACEHVLLGHRGSITAVGISSDGSCVVSGAEDRTVRLWKAGNNYASVPPVKIYDVPVVSVALSWNGSIGVAVSGNGICNLWDVSQYPDGDAKCVASVTFTGLQFGPTTAPAALSAYSQKRGFPPETRVTESISVPGLVSMPVKNGLGLRVSWPVRTARNNGSSSSSVDEFAEEQARSSPGPDPPRRDVRPMASTAAYFENAISKERCLWTPVFCNSSGRKFVAAGLCTGVVAIMEVLE